MAHTPTDEKVDLIASGYEWECPQCKTPNKESELVDEVKCYYCQKSFGVGGFSHAYKG